MFLCSFFLFYRDYCNHSNRTSESPEQEFRNFLQKFKTTVWKWKDRTPQSTEHSSIYCEYTQLFHNTHFFDVIQIQLREVKTIHRTMRFKNNHTRKYSYDDRTKQQTLLVLVINRPLQIRNPTFVSNCCGFYLKKLQTVSSCCFDFCTSFNTFCLLCRLILWYICPCTFLQRFSWSLLYLYRSTCTQRMYVHCTHI